MARVNKIFQKTSKKLDLLCIFKYFIYLFIFPDILTHCPHIVELYARFNSSIQLGCRIMEARISILIEKAMAGYYKVRILFKELFYYILQ